MPTRRAPEHLPASTNNISSASTVPKRRAAKAQVLTPYLSILQTLDCPNPKTPESAPNYQQVKQMDYQPSFPCWIRIEAHAAWCLASAKSRQTLNFPKVPKSNGIGNLKAAEVLQPETLLHAQSFQAPEAPKPAAPRCAAWVVVLALIPRCSASGRF